MAKANSTSSRTPQGTTDERLAGYERFQMFDIDQIRKHGDRALLEAGTTLNLAFDCILSIGAIAELVRCNALEGNGIYHALGDHTTDALLCGIEVLCSHLNERLVDTAQSIHDALNGGAQ
jgi:hypothetical protein